MKICIVAAGLATRLQPLTNYIPKFLINIGKQTGLVEMVKYWKEYSDEFIIIIHPKYESLVRAYFNMYFGGQLKLEIRTIDTALGTAHTIDTALGGDFQGEEIMLSWCDIIPAEPIDLDRLNSTIAHGDGIAVFTVDNKLNRYKFTNNTLVQEQDGDVVGLYYVKFYKPFTGEYVEGQDFADVLSKKFLNQYELKGIIDFGDKPKLFEHLKNADEAREFNAVELHDSFVRKYPLNAQGASLIAKEIAWYKEIFDQKVDVEVPKVFPSLSNDEMIMSRVDGCSIYKMFSDVTHHKKETVQLEIVESIMEMLGHLHSVKFEQRNSQIIQDVKKEAYDKLLARYDEIKDVIAAFGTNIKVVNGLELYETDIKRVVQDLFGAICYHYKDLTEYSLIHGDLQMSNSMVKYNDHRHVVFIDPRGYFGNTVNYGLPDYDIAKVLYSMSGYDLFNYSTSFHIKNLTDTEIEFDIPTPAFATEEVRAQILSRFEPIHYLWLAVIWIGLAGYIKNNPVKSVAAHYHGLYYAHKAMNGDYTL